MQNTTPLQQEESSFERLRFRQPDAFHRELRQWWETRQAAGEHPFANGRDLAKGLFLLLLLGLSYGFLLRSGHSLFSLVLTGILTGQAALLLVFNFGHDASHGAVFPSRRWNNLLNRSLFLFLGIDGFLWTVRHLRAHHPYTNVIGADPDVSVGKVLRVSPNQKQLPFHRYQLFYAPILYFLAIPAGAWWKDFRLLRTGATEKAFGYRLQKADVIQSFFFKFLHLSFWILIPWWCGDRPLWNWLLVYLSALGLASLTFIILAALNHFSEFTEFPFHGGEETMDTTWSEHQLRTNSDWCADSYWVNFFSGGANAHVAHHLFPNLANRHLRSCTREIRRAALEKGLPYRNLDFRGGIRSHLRFLHSLGKGKA